MHLPTARSRDRSVPLPRPLHYRVAMKKKTRRKLIVRSETLRVLDHSHLTQAVGGSVVPERESGEKQCTLPAVATAVCA